MAQYNWWVNHVYLDNTLEVVEGRYMLLSRLHERDEKHGPFATLEDATEFAWSCETAFQELLMLVS